MKTKIATLLLLPFFFASCSEEEGYAVQRKKLVQAVYSSGEVLPAGYYEATSKIPGIVDTVYVRVGQEVKTGTPLLRLQSQAERLNVQTARNLYALARESAAEDAELLSTFGVGSTYVAALPNSVLRILLKNNNSRSCQRGTKSTIKSDCVT